jgi:N-carbamoylputrescine amidase
MTDTFTMGVLQASLNASMDENIKTISELVREAAGQGAQVILPPELFQGPYFCKTQVEDWFATAYPALEHPVRHRHAEARPGTGRGHPRLDL